MTSKAEGPLRGIVVVDLTRVLAGPYCTMVLADLGARVIKVELPVLGDDARHSGPFIDQEGQGPVSGYFFSVNRNKESIALNLKSPEDREIFEALVEEADVLVENFSPGTMHKLGYDWDTVHARWPELVMASISGFGQTGPYRELPAYDMVVQAMGGIMSLTGEENGPPTRVGVSIGDIAAGMFGVMGIQAALLERHRTNRGKHIDVAMLDTQVALLENALVRYQVEGKVPGPIGSRHPSITPFGVFKAKDDPFVLAAGRDAKFAVLCEQLGRAELAQDPRYTTNPLRCENHAALKADIEEALADKTAKQWMAIFKRAGVPCGPLYDVSQLMRDPQIAAREMLVELPLPSGSTLRTAGNPIKFAGDAAPDHRPAPALDQHRQQLLNEINAIQTSRRQK
ncbi:CaiB/BaiF CoA transferase family protein [Variovorax paradoxus]|uniref:CoA transferase n=1 Tax=Variovorax paradoxus TaxID=34073 RepID=A0A6I6HQ84_VARPD|nr:CoA transferase [Variovorax paradoxus]QGW85060.1 CoA transferase [Variovorax paradoxus]